LFRQDGRSGARGGLGCGDLHVAHSVGLGASDALLGQSLAQADALFEGCGGVPV
jgi:hypothetical protein